MGRRHSISGLLHLPYFMKEPLDFDETAEGKKVYAAERGPPNGSSLYFFACKDFESMVQVLRCDV